MMEQRTNSPRILVVDDESSSLEVTRLTLEVGGFPVETAHSAQEARERIGQAGPRAFEGAVVDYEMPGENGLDFLVWLRGEDPTLASIILTANRSNKVAAGTLREGAVDYLEKPVGMNSLCRAVKRAAGCTAERRRLADTATAARQVAETQHHLLGIPRLGGLPQLSIGYHPKHLAGGDFINYLPHPGGGFEVVAGDVSGHDLEAAYISSYFQGIVRGMNEQGGSTQEVFATFNRFLLEDWNAPDLEASLKGWPQTSLAACSARIDPSQGVATVLNFGAPRPLYIDGRGRSVWLGGRSRPLGWYPELAPDEVRQGIGGGGYLYLWSDGLEDLAETLGVSPGALAFRLLHRGERGEQGAATGSTGRDGCGGGGGPRPGFMDAATDDVLVIRIDVEMEYGSAPPYPGPDAPGFQPIVVERYTGDLAGEIDEIQAGWERSLHFALPQLGEDKERCYDLLLGAREALLNALQHGCAGSAEASCILQFHYNPGCGAVRVRVDDPGEGYASTYLSGGGDPPDPADGHTGLILMRSFADRVGTDRGGAAVWMDFDIGPKPISPIQSPISACEPKLT